MDPDKNGNPAPNPDDSTPPADGQTGDDKKGGDSKTFTQEDVDRIVKERLAKAEKKFEDRLNKAVSDAIADYERKSKLSDEDKAKEEEQMKLREIEERERNAALKENRADARELMQEKGIPTNLVDWVVDVDPEKTRENIEALGEAFHKAVSEAVEMKLAGTTPPDRSNPDGGKPSGEDKKSTRELLFGK